MDFSWLQIMLSAVVGLVTALGGSSIFYVSINKRDKKLDVELKEADAWKALYEEEKRKGEQKSAKIRNLYEQIDGHKTNEMNLLSIIRQLKWYRCTCNDCTKREPPRDYTKDVEQLEIDLLKIANNNKTE